VVRAGHRRAAGLVADLADGGLFGTKGTEEFARSSDWRTEADRILAKINREK